MPTVLRTGPYRFFFYAGDRDEPAHVHAERDENVAKFWLSPIRLSKNRGFRPAEIRRIERLIIDNRQKLLEAWDEFFGD